MNGYLLIAAILAIGIGGAHSWLGERYLITRLLRRNDLPHLFGSDQFTQQTIRYAWHLTTAAWWGLALMLLMVSGFFPDIHQVDGVLLIISMTFAASAVLSLIFTKGRHISWVVFVAIAVLCIIAVL